MIWGSTRFTQVRVVGNVWGRTRRVGSASRRTDAVCVVCQTAALGAGGGRSFQVSLQGRPEGQNLEKRSGKARETGWEKRGEGEDPKIKLTVLYAPGVVSRDTPDKTFFFDI